MSGIAGARSFAAPSPVILCEGKTDNVYLVHAIRARAATFPQLATIDPTTSAIKLLVRIFKYVNRNGGKILQLSGGQGELGKFIAHYLDDVDKHFKAPGAPQHPVILIVDNDVGGKGPYQVARKRTKKNLDINKPFEHVAANLYLISTPLSTGMTESCIEDGFNSETLNVILGGKKFNYRSQTIDETKEYGKAYFAEHVIKPNANAIDFSGFDQLLNRIQEVLAHYATLQK